uniref:Putative ovule protein n=1 Tax=Solanum chacoense TaxID=4108 RepID=A0A0V0GZW0_SOLCH
MCDTTKVWPVHSMYGMCMAPPLLNCCFSTPWANHDARNEDSWTDGRNCFREEHCLQSFQGS